MRPLLAIAVLSVGWTPVQAFELVSTQEMLASMAAPEPLRAKAGIQPGAPVIEVVRPKLSAPISSPSTIELLFQSAAPSAVRPETFKAFYGRLRIDITPRLLNATQVTAQGITVKEASLPKGSHRLLLSIEDSEGRQGQKMLEFEVN
ncbi:hypothetical protein [Limnohabitans radicicola]|nr:hypothetical protein [Limnohabitans radicicola]